MQELARGLEPVKNNRMTKNNLLTSQLVFANLICSSLPANQRRDRKQVSLQGEESNPSIKQKSIQKDTQNKFVLFAGYFQIHSFFHPNPQPLLVGTTRGGTVAGRGRTSGFLEILGSKFGGAATNGFREVFTELGNHVIPDATRQLTKILVDNSPQTPPDHACGGL